jgi:monofunctional glycosyltransferase
MQSPVTPVQTRSSRAFQVKRMVGRIVLPLLLGPAVLILLFRFVAPPATPLMVLRLIEGYGLNHAWVPYDRIAPALAQAVVASEDNWFCREQFGVDFDAMAGQILAWRDGERPRGASTITMQTTRNLLLWPGRDPIRKLIEGWLTPQVALLWPKRRVLEVYLNVIEFGPGIYGAEAASRRMFGRSAAALTREQAVQLALVLPDPLHRSAAHPGPYVRERAETIARRIDQLGPLLDCTR